MEEVIFQKIRNKCHKSNSYSIRLASKEIASHFKDFARWAIINAVVPFDKKDEYIYIESGKVFKDIDELYNYWSDNVSKEAMKYTKVIIKSKDDLPKDNNWYVGFSGVINDFVFFNPTSSNCNNIDWYLIEDTEPSYPEEFVKWAMFEQDDFVKTCDGDFKSRSRNPIEDTGVYYTLDELYNYWLNEIKDK